ncbi:hypothetical protein GH714_026392 [Hevea brasiliensis]|uniref:non-specific serine/threonine protein kinase n=1 Tax=Hevea brasiliensis TaxID=3981 RepID=A0A6A6ML34_HEVBR|nr:hypothetical protein GH714_026392 [Hevea brasiliensis]
MLHSARLSLWSLLANRLTSSIPQEIGNIATLEELVLGDNLLEGPLPSNLGNLRSLKRLLLSANNFTGVIPDTFGNLKNLTDLYLQGTSMEGPIPTTISLLTNLIELRISDLNGASSNFPDLKALKKIQRLDLSFNKLTGPIPGTFKRLQKLNYMFLTNNSLTGILPDWILNSNRTYHSLFINCGGHKMTFENNEYEEDVTPSGPSTFFSAEKWAYSSTGLYMGNDSAEFIARTSFGSNVTRARLYESARLAPQSLKYYGLCMRQGSYKVKLHFAEIMYSNDQSYCSLGRRIFDVSIQGNVVLKDFNIMEKAGGARISHVEEFDNILVNGSSTLEIHLYWLGKGTTAIPTRSVYGPLISAITVTPNFKVDDGGLLVAAIIGIVATSCFVVVLILLVLRRKGYLGVKDLEDKEFRGLDLQTGYFSLRQIKQATNSFDVANQIGEGGFGPVYKGVLPDGTIIAVKQLSSKSKQGNREFVNEIGMISALQHPNLVRLYGCCIEGNQLLLVYEYLENNSLARALLVVRNNDLKWIGQQERKYCWDLNAKISDFGLAKLDEEENTHISTRIAGTVGYMAPEYAMRGYLTDKADVYSFGVVGLEIVSGKSNTNYRPKEEFVYLLDWAYVLQEQGNLLELVDPNLGSNYSKQEAMSMLNLALLCTNPSPTLRPSMSSVVSMVEGEIPVQALIIKRGSMDQDASLKPLRFYHITAKLTSPCSLRIVRIKEACQVMDHG